MTPRPFPPGQLSISPHRLAFPVQLSISAHPLTFHDDVRGNRQLPTSPATPVPGNRHLPTSSGMPCAAIDSCPGFRGRRTRIVDSCAPRSGTALLALSTDACTPVHALEA